MSSIGQITGTTTAKSGCTCIGRVYGNDGNLVTQATFSGITYTVTRLDSLTPTSGETFTGGTDTQTGTGTLTVSSVVFNSLQTTDPRWTKDTTGYNFLATIPASCFQVGGVKHRIDIYFTPTSGEVFVQSFATIPIKVA